MPKLDWNYNSCKTPLEIDNFFKMKNLNLVLVDSVFQPHSYELPYKTKLSYTLYKLEPSVTMKLQKASLTTEETVISSLKRSIDAYAYETEKSEYGLVTSMKTEL